MLTCAVDFDRYAHWNSTPLCTPVCLVRPFARLSVSACVRCVVCPSPVLWPLGPVRGGRGSPCFSSLSILSEELLTSRHYLFSIVLPGKSTDKTTASSLHYGYQHLLSLYQSNYEATTIPFICKNNFVCSMHQCLPAIFFCSMQMESAVILRCIHPSITSFK